jgi:putative hydrolase of HD superfamily
MSDTTNVVDAQIEAYRAKDIERYLSHFADDASVVFFDGTPMSSDKEAIRLQYGKMFADSPDLQVTIANRIVSGEFVIDEEHLSGFNYGGMPREMTAVAIYRVVDGKIARMMILG